MKNFLLSFSYFLLSTCFARGQEKVGEINAIDGFSKGDYAMAYVGQHGNFHVNLQRTSSITRFLYDSDLRLISSYDISRPPITLKGNGINKPQFVTDLDMENGVYELYRHKEEFLVVQTDFINHLDTIVDRLAIREIYKDERILAVMPSKAGVNILSYSNDQSKFILYNWIPGTKSKTTEYAVPAPSLTPDEEKNYSKEVKVKYKKSLENLVVAKINSPFIISRSGDNFLYYSSDRIYIILRMPYGIGYHLMKIETVSNELTTVNYFLNNLKKNAEAQPNEKKNLAVMIFDSTLLIQNSSYGLLEYHFFDLSGHVVKEYKSSSDNSLAQLINSDLNQQGTWLSKNDDKDINSERAFLRKLNSGQRFIDLSEMNADSLTITTGSLVPTEGIEGMALSFATSLLIPPVQVGNFEIYFYLQSHRNKLVYAHARFSKTGLVQSGKTGIKTALDQFLDNVSIRDAKSESSFMVKKEGHYYVGVFQPTMSKFEIYKF